MIESNLEEKTLRITFAGKEILRDDTVCCPIGNEKLACYTITPGTITVPTPSDWNPSEVMAVALYPDRREETGISWQSGTAAIKLESRRPVIIYPTRARANLKQ